MSTPAAIPTPFLSHQGTLDDIAALGHDVAEQRVRQDHTIANLATSASQIARRLAEEMDAYGLTDDIEVPEGAYGLEYARWGGPLSRRRIPVIAFVARRVWRPGDSVVHLMFDPRNPDRVWADGDDKLPSLGIRPFSERALHMNFNRLADPDILALFMRDLPKWIQTIRGTAAERTSALTQANAQADTALGLLSA